MEVLLPILLDESSYCGLSVRPDQVLNQLFGIGLDIADFLQPVQPNNREGARTRTPAGYQRRGCSRGFAKDTGSTVVCNKDNFEANLDVQQFQPEEITVKVTGDHVLTIEGKQEEKEDQHGHISRHFVRRYILPKNYDISKIQSKLSSDGILTITAPAIEEKGVEYKNVPITRTDEPAKQQASESAKQQDSEPAIQQASEPVKQAVDQKEEEENR